LFVQRPTDHIEENCMAMVQTCDLFSILYTSSGLVVEQFTYEEHAEEDVIDDSTFEVTFQPTLSFTFTFAPSARILVESEDDRGATLYHRIALPLLDHPS
jgi:hypothetical protein